jgi:CRISPR-associated endonuclease/helicase Cas3
MPVVSATPLHTLLPCIGVAAPYKWQAEAYGRLLVGTPPAQIRVPTAAGKTLMLAVFVAALAEQARSGRTTLPRRLVHVVNRRVLVDEASRLAATLVAALKTDQRLQQVSRSLASLSATGEALITATLRGELTDDGAWANDPTTPAIILATPDMLGSRLLFRGYGLGRSRSATHAGLLAYDTLVIHDEAHLAPAFTSLLRQVEARTAKGSETVGRPPLRVIEMTATLASGATDRALVCDVAGDDALSARMSAKKSLEVRRVDAPDDTAKTRRAVDEKLADLAASEGKRGHAVAIFVGFPASADLVANRLMRGGVSADRIVMLTGTMRGHERAKLSEREAFRRFDTGEERTAGECAFFISTAAGEIGLDIDADVGLFDLTTVDRVVQRAGRINRRGIKDGRIHIVHAGGAELPDALRFRGETTLELLASLPSIQRAHDASPLALSALLDHPRYAEAVEPAPPLRSLEPAIVDMLSMTSLSLGELRCPAPDVFIHGVVEADADVYLAWRGLPAPPSDVSDWLDAWPVVPAELAKLPIGAARDFLRACMQRADRIMTDCRLAIVLDAQGAPDAGFRIVETSQGDTRWIYRIRPGAILLLSTQVGGLSTQGLPSAEADAPVTDVSAGFVDAAGVERVEVRSVAMECVHAEEVVQWRAGELVAATLDELFGLLAPDLDVVFHDAPRAFDDLHWSGTVTLWLARRRIRSADSGDLASISVRDRALDEHLDLTARAARRVAGSLGLRDALIAALVRAAAEHDQGKAWARWQYAIGNRDLAHPLGKSTSAAFDFKANDGYRHELGSVVDGGAHMTPLERHLVAAHHGWARPGFRANALDKPGCAAAAVTASRSFAALCETMNPWAVSYLEALLKSADILAELKDASLAADPPAALPQLVEFDLAPPVKNGVVEIGVDITNFGEYLAALGLAALLLHDGTRFELGWAGSRFRLQGIDERELGQSLCRLRGAKAEIDLTATAEPQRTDPYPPLLLRFADGRSIALNHWCSERLINKSAWKLGAGQTTAIKTLTSVLTACVATLSLPSFKPTEVFRMGGGLVDADASKFRFDAATNWSARDAGFSLNERDSFKSTRPWVELLAALGLQHFFPPPADEVPTYYTWRGTLPPLLALAAAKGLLPESDSGFRPVFEPNGRMKDVFPSQRLDNERTSPWPKLIRLN